MTSIGQLTKQRCRLCERDTIWQAWVCSECGTSHDPMIRAPTAGNKLLNKRPFKVSNKTRHPPITPVRASGQHLELLAQQFMGRRLGILSQLLGDTTREQRVGVLRAHIREKGLQQEVAGRRGTMDGRPETWSQFFARAFGEPL